MLSLTINRQAEYSRGKLLLKTFFGIFYVAIPHSFMIAIYGIWFFIQSILAGWLILFKGNLPESWFEYRMKYFNYVLRVNAYLLYLSDTYPGFSLDASDDNVKMELKQPESLKKITNFLIFIKIIMIIPHIFLSYIYQIGMAVCTMIAWFVILFTGSYPEGLFNFVVSGVRFIFRIAVYQNQMTDDYPPFSGKE